ncbi:hypothetical protein SAMN05518855_102438 [Paenibacillus sp. CF384]|nr:hypothetical protein SAMN05518855_102438 [Paenibacillus sp. CF384]
MVRSIITFFKDPLLLNDRKNCNLQFASSPIQNLQGKWGN